MENLDTQETEHFSKMADRWWDPQGPCQPLHDLNPIRLQFINDRTPLQGKRVLDVGCGAGILTESLAKRGAIVTGIDASQELITAAQDHAAQAGLMGLSDVPDVAVSNMQPNVKPITYLHTTIEDFLENAPQPLEQFDVITCLELLEHVPNPESLINACAQLIKPGGDLFFSTLNRNFKSYMMAIIGAEYLLKLLPKNTHHYEKFIRPSELDQALRKAGLKLKDIAGLHYNPFTRNASLIQDVSVNYIVYAIPLSV